MAEKNNRFIERRTEKSRRIKTTMRLMFNPFDTFNGMITELSQDGAKVLIDNDNSQMLDKFLEKHFFLTFKFSQYNSVVTPAASIRVDKVEEGKNLVFSFFDLGNKHSSTINDIIDTYGVAAS